MIQLSMREGETYIELGGGEHPQVRPNCDVRPGPNVDIVADFNKPLPFPNKFYDGAFSQFAIEHISWRNVITFIAEVFRIIKDGGKFVCVMPNTEAQMGWILNNPNGWDDKGPFEACSEVLYGSQDYPENSHRAYFSPGVIQILFNSVGFVDLQVIPYGDRKTDMCVVGTKPSSAPPMGTIHLKQDREVPVVAPRLALPNMSREEMFDKKYFNGGGKVGGYAREGYRDFPVHEITAQHVLAKRPESVLELGCARGYILKRLQSAGVESVGLEISRHCVMTRVTDPVYKCDLCGEWPPHVKASSYDLCFSIATFEHVPEDSLPGVLRQMKETTKRGLHGIDFGGKDDGFDKTHCTLRPKTWWRKLFDEHGLQSHDIVDKEELEQGHLSPEYLKGDGKVKVSVGTFINMLHHGWVNIDVHDLQAFASQNAYIYRQHDIRNGLPFGTGTVSFIHGSHVFEHLTYEDGRRFLNDCRRAINPNGVVRLVVPNAGQLIREFSMGSLGYFDEINDGCEKATSQAEKLYRLLNEGHSAVYDADALCDAFEDAGFTPTVTSLTKSLSEQLLHEIVEIGYDLSLFVDAVPRV